MSKKFEAELFEPKNLPERGILSERIFKNDHTAMVMLHLAPGEELNEHTSKFPVWIQTIDGRFASSGKVKSACYPQES